jgi:formate C-acetyltransferase
VFNNPYKTAPLLSLLVDDCIETARDYHQRGARYSFQAPHAGGLPDVANSLYIIKQTVFTDQRITYDELIAMLRANWVGHEQFQRQLALDYHLYGNADPEADAMMRRVFDDYVTLAARYGECAGILCPPGISTFGREIEWQGCRLATAFGRPAHAILAGNLSPTPGTEKRGVTAAVRSYCSMDFEKLPNGVPLDLTLSPSSLTGENGLQALEGLLRTFVLLGGWYLQINVVNQETLREAQRHPELFPNLTVRISGWSARFATLDAEWQEMVIQRVAQGF